MEFIDSLLYSLLFSYDGSAVKLFQEYCAKGSTSGVTWLSFSPFFHSKHSYLMNLKIVLLSCNSENCDSG